MEAPIAELKDRLQEAMNLREKKAADLANDLGIPKSALSQYLSGKSKNMDSVRMYRLCVYLNGRIDGQIRVRIYDGNMFYDIS